MPEALTVIRDSVSPRPEPAPIGVDDVFAALRDGARIWRANYFLASTYAAVFALIGATLVILLAAAGFAPMAVILTGGFLILGPVLLLGFFGIARAYRSGRSARWSDVVRSFSRMPLGLAGLSAIMLFLFLFLVWLADASILYGFVLGGGEYHWADMLPRSAALRDFQFAAALMGAGFAMIAFPFTAYSVPLLLERRANLAVAVSASVRAVFRSVRANAVWALVLALTVFASMALLPLLMVSLPVLGLSAESLYRRTFTAGEGEFCEVP